jgi:DNA-binding GntR family transcriptional regulator
VHEVELARSAFKIARRIGSNIASKSRRGCTAKIPSPRSAAVWRKLSRVEALVEAEPDRYGEAWERYNQEFHDALIANCRSRWLKVFHRAMYDHSKRYRMLSSKTKRFPRPQSAEEHRQILAAAIARDAETAEHILAAHILKGAEIGILKPAPASGEDNPGEVIPRDKNRGDFLF